jgi:hypothetical protein
MPEQPQDMAEQPREAFIYIFGYRGLDVPQKKMPAAEALSLAELIDRWTRERWQVLPMSGGGGIIVRTLTASNRIKPDMTHNLQLHANDGDHTIHGFDPRTDELHVYGVTNARLEEEEDSTAGAVKVHLPDGRVITLALGRRRTAPPAP